MLHGGLVARLVMKVRSFMNTPLLRHLGLALALGCSTAHATLIGDTITVAHDYPSLGTHYTGPTNVLVQVGTADTFLFGGGTMGMNPEAASLSVSPIPSANNIIAIPASFNGLVITNIDDTISGLGGNDSINGDAGVCCSRQRGAGVYEFGLTRCGQTNEPHRDKEHLHVE